MGQSRRLRQSGAEVMDTLNERLSAYRVEPVSADDMVKEMNTRMASHCPRVIQVTADEDDEPVGSVDSDEPEFATPPGSPSNRTGSYHKSLAYPGTLESLCPTSDEE